MAKGVLCEGFVYNIAAAYCRMGQVTNNNIEICARLVASFCTQPRRPPPEQHNTVIGAATPGREGAVRI